LGIVEDVFGFITSGSIAGLSPLVLMIIPLVIGVVVGFLLHKFLKFAIIAAAIAIIVAYLGFYTLNLGSMTDFGNPVWPHRCSAWYNTVWYVTVGHRVHNWIRHRLSTLKISLTFFLSLPKASVKKPSPWGMVISLFV